jgi:hypothetical protein
MSLVKQFFLEYRAMSALSGGLQAHRDPFHVDPQLYVRTTKLFETYAWLAAVTRAAGKVGC